MVESSRFVALQSAPLIEMYGSVTAQKILKGGKKAAFARGEPAPEDMKKSAGTPSRGKAPHRIPAIFPPGH
jgi:hypothetical protein